MAEIVKLFSLRKFLIWNITIQAGAEFEISEFIAKELIHRGVCITKEEREKRLAEKAARKAQGTPTQKKTKKSKETEVSV